ncbi:PREDICTED: DNA repair protein RAD51 homolog 4 isoform X2 [Theobroma cacao]|uniref:DNA repair protein RAD51 homolog 4 isoform X2 n=1 Tax=Theobroma cacao TaxID=3641 RepID=A0AB32X0Z5_THECC|nr:PREDICTED: DNA repair protein RAD51 homolog 4 isoform X2 [Theobroma cacao]
MAPLKNLEQDYTIIDSNFLNFCASHGIFSVEDFLIHDLYKLAAFAEQNISSERLKEGITQVLSIIDDMHQPWLNGMELLEDAKRNKHSLPTGIQGIDFLLGGGIRVGQLTELVGPSSSGKTQVCLQTASNVASNHMGTVVYLDTGNSFSPQRIAHFLGMTNELASSEIKNQILQRVMSNILCHSVFDIFEMFDVLHKLEYRLRSQDRGVCQMRLLIIDSISLLITPVLGGTSSQGRALMVSAGYLLKKLADQHNLAVLVTNHTVGGEGGTSKPALGESWKSIPHSRLLLSCDRGSNVCNVSILKHPSMAGFTTHSVHHQRLLKFVIPVAESSNKGAN